MGKIFPNLYIFIKLMFLKAIALLVLLSCTFSFQIQSNDIQCLGFNNVTEFFSPAFITLFRNLINSGSSFYKNNTQKKLEYISDGLNQNYPVANRAYSVFVENGTVT
jgi:hypothetical protein